jgi:iron complex outermembrane receptor protein
MPKNRRRLTAVAAEYGGGKMFLQRFKFALAASTILAPIPALAQESATASATQSQVDETSEIVVTARRREERLIDVPASVSALGEAVLDRAQVQTVSDIGTIVPNIQINQTIGNTFGPLISLRGLSPSADTSLARDQPVGLYVDGVPIGKSTGAAFDTIDLERVEVLRGPQGTLYGRNSIGGAVNLVTKAPSGEFGAQLEASTGSFGSIEASAIVDLPEVSGFSMKVAATHRKSDGYYFNSATQRGFGEQELSAGRVDVLWAPSDAFTARYSFDLTDSTGTPAQLVTTAVTGSGSTAFVNGLLAPYVVSRRTKTTGSQSALNSDFRVNGHALTLEWQPGLGDMTVKSISAWRSAKTRSSSDFDGSPLDLFRFILNNNYRQFTQEFQATGTAGPIEYTAGLFYLDDSYDVFNPRWNFQFGGNSAFDISERGGNSNSYAAYGQLEWTPKSFEERLTVGLGARYTKEEKSAYELLLANSTYRTAPASAGSGVFRRDASGNPVTRSGQPAAGARPGAGGIGYTDLFPLTNSDTWTSFTPALNVLYRFTPNFTVYGRIATGFKSGGINDTAATNAAFLTPYNQEDLTSFEAGLKYVSSDRRLRLDLAAYESIYKDFQAGVFVPALVTTNIVNAGEARFSGVELEGSFRLFDGLNLTFGGGVIDPRYTDFVLPNGTNVTSSYVFPRVPKSNYQLGALYERNVGFGALETSVNWSWRDAQFTNIVNDPLAKLPAYGLLSGRIGLTDIKVGRGGELEVSVWGENLTDEEYKVAAINLSVLTLGQYGDPKSYGAEVRIRF